MYRYCKTIEYYDYWDPNKTRVGLTLLSKYKKDMPKLGYVQQVSGFGTATVISKSGQLSPIKR